MRSCIFRTPVLSRTFRDVSHRVCFFPPCRFFPCAPLSCPESFDHFRPSLQSQRRAASGRDTVPARICRSVCMYVCIKTSTRTATRHRTRLPLGNTHHKNRQALTCLKRLALHCGGPTSACDPSCLLRSRGSTLRGNVCEAVHTTRM